MVIKLYRYGYNGFKISMNNYFNFCDLFCYYKFDVILLESFEFGERGGGGGFWSFFIIYFFCKSSWKVCNLFC